MLPVQWHAVENGDHNDTFIQGSQGYYEAFSTFVSRLVSEAESGQKAAALSNSSSLAQPLSQQLSASGDAKNSAALSAADMDALHQRGSARAPRTVMATAAATLQQLGNSP